MADKMTLEQLRDWHRSRMTEDASPTFYDAHRRMADALDAHIAAMGEPVGEASAMPGTNGGFTIATFRAAYVPVGTKLYLAPPAPIDAHLEGMGEPVGFILRSVTPPYDYWPESFVLGEPQEDESEAEHWEPIYAHPPASGDWDKVREAIAILDADGDEWGCAAMLTAALPENAK